MKCREIYKLFLVVFCGVILMSGCHLKQAEESTISGNQFAKGFTISEGEKWTKLVVFSPWQSGQVLQTYYLV